MNAAAFTIYARTRNQTAFRRAGGNGRVSVELAQDRQEHADAVLPADSHHAGEPVHRARRARRARRGGLWDLQCRGGRGDDVRLFVGRDGDGKPALWGRTTPSTSRLLFP